MCINKYTCFLYLYRISIYMSCTYVRIVYIKTQTKTHVTKITN